MKNDRSIKKIGILLSGCRFLDGAEIQESALTLLAQPIFAAIKDLFFSRYKPEYRHRNKVSNLVALTQHFLFTKKCPIMR